MGRWVKSERSKPKDGAQEWMTDFEKKVCDLTNHKGFTSSALAEHGIPWPPPAGWRKALRTVILARGGGPATRREPVAQPRAAARTPAPTISKAARRLAATSFENDRERLDLAGFAETARMMVRSGPGSTVVLEQTGFFAVALHADGKAPACRYIIVKKSTIPTLIKELRALR